MLDQKQIRAARGLLDWTQETLAERSGVARATIKNVESGNTLPRLETANALQRAFEESGVEFLPRSGVRMKDNMIQIHEGQEAPQKLLDDVYNTLKSTGGVVCIAHVDEAAFINGVGGDVLERHLKRLAQANIKERMLIKKGASEFPAPLESYRAISEEYFSKYPFYIYDTKIGLASWEDPFKSVIINDARFADAARKLFNFIWERTEMPSNKGTNKV